MPHLVLAGLVPASEILARFAPEVWRWQRAVLKAEACWVRQDGQAVLVEGVVVELSRPLHPVALVEARGGGTVVRLWRRSPVERTPAVQRWLALVAARVSAWGAGPVTATNLPPELWSDLAPATGLAP